VPAAFANQSAFFVNQAIGLMNCWGELRCMPRRKAFSKCLPSATICQRDIFSCQTENLYFNIFRRIVVASLRTSGDVPDIELKFRNFNYQPLFLFDSNTANIGFQKAKKEGIFKMPSFYNGSLILQIFKSWPS